MMVPPPPTPMMVPPPANPLGGGWYGTAPAESAPKAPLGPQPGQEEFYRRPDNWPGRTYLVRYVGERIHAAQETPLNVRAKSG